MFLLDESWNEFTFTKAISPASNIFVFKAKRPGVVRSALETVTITDKVRDDDGLSKVRIVFEVPSLMMKADGTSVGTSKADVTLFLPNQASESERRRLKNLIRSFFEKATTTDAMADLDFLPVYNDATVATVATPAP